MSRTLLVLASLLALGACGKKETTPAGPVGAPIDLRSHLSADALAKAPAEEKATRAELPVDAHGAKAKLTWRTFADGPRKYILSAQWQVESPAPGVTLESNGLIGQPVNASAAETANEQVNIGLRWHDTNVSGTSLGDVVVTIRADGTGNVLK